MVVIRRLGQCSKVSNLRHTQLIQALVEIDLRGGGHAIGLLTKEDFIQIKFKNAILAERLFDTQRQNRLPRLAGEGPVRAHQHVLRHLLGDGGSATHAPPAAILLSGLDHGAQNAQGVNAGMFAKALILGRDESLLDALRNRLDRDKDAPFLRQFGHQPAIGGIDAAHLRGFIFGKPAIIRQILREMLIGAIGSDAARQNHCGAKAQHPTEQTKAPPALGALFRFFLGRRLGTRRFRARGSALWIKR